jgi:ribosomal protein S28E/S33
MTKKSWHANFKRASVESRTSVDGIVFDSVGELKYAQKLKLWQLAGEVRNIRRQVKYPLERGDIRVLTETGRVACYTADFVFERKVLGQWEEVIAEYKGFEGKFEMFRIRVFEALYKKKATIVKG